MADVQSNVSKGRAVELAIRVDTNDPTNSALVWVAIVSTDTEDARRDTDTLSALLALSSTAEATNSVYARKVLTDSDIGPFSPDDTNNKYTIDLPDISWGNVASGDNWTHLVLCYDNDTTGGDDTNLIPIGIWDFSVSPDGTSLTTTINASGAFESS